MKFLAALSIFSIAAAIPSRPVAADESQYFQDHGLRDRTIEILATKPKEAKKAMFPDPLDSLYANLNMPEKQQIIHRHAKKPD